MEPISLELFLNHLRNAVVVARADGGILLMNSVFKTLFQAQNPTNLFEVFLGTPSLVEALHRVHDFRGSYFLRDQAVQLPKKLRKMDVDTHPIIAESGDLLAIAVILHDRSEDAPFEEHQKRMDRMDYLKTIAVGLAHEIRNPLSGIRGAGQLLAKSLKNEELKEYATIIQKEVDRVDQLLKDLLHFTKPRQLNWSPTNVNQVLHDLILLQKTASPEIEFREFFDPSLPSIKANGEALSQVFLNLIKNARQALDKNGVVTIRSRMVTDFVLKKGQKKSSFIGVDVEDDGPGMDASTLASIFVPLFTTKPKGSGLGLAICHQLITAHGGNITVRSELGRGTKFSVYLPL